MVKILVTEPEYFPENFLEQLKEFGNVVAKRTSSQELLSEIEDADVAVIRVDTKINRDVLERAKKLKLIASATTGLDHIDLNTAEEMKIKVINPIGYATETTAEYTFAMILSLARKISWASESLKSGKWERHEFIGHQLSGKTLGVIGIGRIGRNIAKYAIAFGMKVLAHDPYVSAESATEIGAELVQLEKLLKESDFITINVALTPETKGLINKTSFGLMKKAAMLVNTSRGPVVDENDLVDALKEKIIAGAAFDVFSDEPLLADSQLVEYSKNNRNLLITPHIGGSTEEAMQNACSNLLEKIREHLQKSGS